MRWMIAIVCVVMWAGLVRGEATTQPATSPTTQPGWHVRPGANPALQGVVDARGSLPSAALSSVEARISELDSAIQSLRREPTPRDAAGKRERGDRLRQMNSDLAAARSQAEELRQHPQFAWPNESPDSWKVGIVSKPGATPYVEHVLDDTSMIAVFKWSVSYEVAAGGRTPGSVRTETRYSDMERRVILRGVSTKGVVDGQRVPNLFACVATGTGNDIGETLLVVEPVAEDDIYYVPDNKKTEPASRPARQTATASPRPKPRQPTPRPAPPINF